MRTRFLLLFVLISGSSLAQTAWIRINQLGYLPAGKKVAVWCSKTKQSLATFELVDSASGKAVFKSKASKPYGAYGPFTSTHRLDFSSFQKSGKYFLRAGGSRSPMFRIGQDVYKGSADFCLRYMRQQRCGFNPFLKDSCHTNDGYPVDQQVRITIQVGDSVSTDLRDWVDVVGGWHDASDYLQYATTSANAAYHLMMAYRDFPSIFSDTKDANGLDGINGRADVLDEAEWGIKWLSKMHPSINHMYNQIADDRDHMGFRIPKEDSFYGRGFQRPVYFLTGKPQGLFKYKNNTTGTTSTAAKFSSVFSIAMTIFDRHDSLLKDIDMKNLSALSYAYWDRGYTQTAPGKAPYYYAEENFHDDLELAYVAMYMQMGQSDTPQFFRDPKIKKEVRDKLLQQYLSGLEKGRVKMLDSAYALAREEPITPWLGADTARHYQWYPFVNLGHYELAKQLKGGKRDTVVGYYRQGIEKVWKKAKTNAFYRGVPFIWCSNNLTTSFAIQCYWYRQLSGSKEFMELEQANIDWLFGLNPWGTSMVYGLPAWGDTPTDPHSAFTKLKNYPIDGGLVDGPVYGSIFNNLIGIKIYNGDEYAPFQSKLAVYHDDFGDYSTNEPTMDGTASLIYLLAAMENAGNVKK